MGRHILRSVGPHGPEFIDLKMALMDAHPFLSEKDRSRRVQLDGNTQDQEDR